MLVDDLTPFELRRYLRGTGLRVRTGPVVNCIRTSIGAVESGISLLYARHPLEDEQGFADFNVSVEAPAGVRRWWRRQVEFHFDGDSPFNPLPGDQGFPMLEWGLNWCVTAMLHTHVILHAAVLERGGRALLLPAPSGSGKSTLCAGLAFDGWRLLSDELALIDPSSLQVRPLPRPISLKNASIDVIRTSTPEAVFSPVVHDTVKGSVAHVRPPEKAVSGGQETAVPGWIVLPRYVAGSDTRLAPLPKARALMLLIDNAFNYSVHGVQGFECLAAVVDRCDCYEFTYSRLSEAKEVMRGLAETGISAAPASGS